MGRPTILTPEIHRSVIAAIRAGAFTWIAAEASGVSKTTLKRWLKKGDDGKEPFKAFAEDLRQARAQARLAAEIEVRKEAPFAWLRYGPGRERDDEPGWTESKELHHSGAIDVARSPEWLVMASTIDQALAPYPEARLAVAEALRRIEAEHNALLLDEAGEDDDEVDP